MVLYVGSRHCQSDRVTITGTTSFTPHLCTSHFFTHEAPDPYGNTFSIFSLDSPCTATFLFSVRFIFPILQHSSAGLRL